MNSRRVKASKDSLLFHAKCQGWIHESMGDLSVVYLLLFGMNSGPRKKIIPIYSVPLDLYQVDSIEILFGDTLIVNGSQLVVNQWLYNSYGFFNKRISNGNNQNAVELMLREQVVELQAYPLDTETIEGGTFVGGGSPPYFFWHWFLEYLPRLIFCFESNHLNKISEKIFLWDDLPLGFRNFIPKKYQHKIQYIPRTDILRLKECNIISSPIYRTADQPVFNFNLDLLRGLRRFICSHYAIKETTEKDKQLLCDNNFKEPALFLSRSSAGWRRIKNREQVLQVVKKYYPNIEVLDFSKIEVSEQVRKVRAARMIFSESGSGDAFASIMSGPNKVIVLFKPLGYVGEIQNIISSLSGNLEMTVYGETQKDEPESGPWQITDSDYTINVEQLHITLDYIVKEFSNTGDGNRLKHPYDYLHFND